MQAISCLFSVVTYLAIGGTFASSPLGLYTRSKSYYVCSGEVSRSEDTLVSLQAMCMRAKVTMQQKLSMTRAAHCPTHSTIICIFQEAFKHASLHFMTSKRDLLHLITPLSQQVCTSVCTCAQSKFDVCRTNTVPEPHRAK